MAAMPHTYMVASGCCGVNYSKDEANYLPMSAHNPLGLGWKSIRRSRWSVPSSRLDD